MSEPSLGGASQPNRPQPSFRSAITTAYPDRPEGEIVLADESSFAKTLVRSDQPQFGVSFGASRLVGEALVCGTRPDEWTLIGSADAVSAGLSQVATGGFTSVVPFTHGRSLFHLTGDLSPRLLEKVCGLDFDDAMTPDGAVVSASVALTTCDLIRYDLHHDEHTSVMSYLLMCDRSYGQYLFDALLDAGAEFGISVRPDPRNSSRTP